MTNIEELAATLRALCAAFERVGVDWAIGGSIASSVYGEPRATNDVDVIALLDQSSARRLGAALGHEFYFSEDAALDAVRLHDSFNVIDQRSFLKVDIFVPPPGALGRGQLVRRQELELVGGVRAPVLGPEDVILQKLRWYRVGGEVSDRQWRDLVAVLASVEALDDRYLDDIAQANDLRALLERARSDARP